MRSLNSVVTPKGPAPAHESLTQGEAESRLAAEGFNELPRARRRTPLRIVFEVLREPMLALLIAGGVVYLLLGSREEALVLLAFACLSVGITVVQEARTERVLEALRDLTSPRALVIRDGERLRVAGREVARGDLIVLAEGDRVPADAVLLEAAGLSADESLLTGEAVPVRKRVGTPDPDTRPGGEDLPVVFSGSLIVGGSAIAEVTATGPASEIGKIGASLATLETENRAKLLVAQTLHVLQEMQPRHQPGGQTSASLPIVEMGAERVVETPPVDLRRQTQQLMLGVQHRLQRGSEQVVGRRFGLLRTHGSLPASLLSRAVQHAAPGRGFPYAQARTQSQAFWRIPAQTLRNAILQNDVFIHIINAVRSFHGRLSGALPKPISWEKGGSRPTANRRWQRGLAVIV